MTDLTYGRAKDLENALAVLEGLEALGDLSEAEREELDSLRAQSGEIGDEIGRTGAAYRGGLQGLSFQQADEIYGLLGGDTEAARLKNLEAETAYPEEYNAGKTAGALTSGIGMGVATGPLAAGKTLLGTMGRGALLGGLEGALWGSGGGETAEEKADEAKKYAALGVLGGALVPAAVKAGGSAYRFGDDLVRGALNKGNHPRANRAIMDSLRKAGLTVDDVADDVARAAAQGQPEYRVMDAMGKAGQRRASGVARAGGDGAEEIAAYLEARQMGQPERVAAFTDEAFDLGGSTADEISGMLKKNRGMQADIDYAAARGNSAPVDVRDAVAAIDDRIGGMQGSNIAGDSIDAKLSRYRGRLMADPAPNGEISRELSDFNRVLGVKQDIQDDIGAALRAGRNNEARELQKLAAELDAALEDASDMYRTANDSFAAASRPIDAIEEGKKMVRPSLRAGDTTSRFDAMTPDEQAGARVGYGDRLLAKIEANTSPTANRAKVLQSPKVAQEVDAIAADPQLLKERMGRETTMWETQNRALGGSRTADNLEDIADIGPAASAIRATQDVTSGNLGNAIVQAGHGAARVATGQNEATRALIAKMLMSDDPSAALSGALRQFQGSETKKRIAEALLRAVGRDKGVPALGL